MTQFHLISYFVRPTICFLFLVKKKQEVQCFDQENTRIKTTTNRRKENLMAKLENFSFFRNYVILN